MLVPLPTTRLSMKTPDTKMFPAASAPTPYELSEVPVPPSCLTQTNVPSGWYLATAESMPPMDVRVCLLVSDPNDATAEKVPDTTMFPLASKASAL